LALTGTFPQYAIRPTFSFSVWSSVSIRAREGERKGRVVSKPVYCLIRNVKFRVHAGGLARIRLKGVRNVCAFTRGQARDATESEVASIAARGMRIHFDPYRSNHFHLDDGTPVVEAEALAIDHKKACIVGPSCLSR
jgi:hypothetical protein